LSGHVSLAKDDTTLERQHLIRSKFLLFFPKYGTEKAVDMIREAPECFSNAEIRTGLEKIGCQVEIKGLIFKRPVVLSVPTPLVHYRT